MAGVVFVSAISLAPYVLFRNSDDPGSIATFFLVLVIGYAGYGASRTGGLTLRRSILTAVVMVFIAGTVAVVKATLTH
jgi:hypothetical protein